MSTIRLSFGILTASKTRVEKINVNLSIETKKTCLGPTYGGPINKFLVVRTNNDKEFYLAYSTKEKVFNIR
jgi:hypothetical protein